MDKQFKFFILFFIPLLSLVVSCGDDEEDDVVQEPIIVSVSPEEGLPGTVVTITGTNLADVNEVEFGGVPAEDFDPTENTATTITATVPEGATVGAQTIIITSPAGTAEIDFTVLEDVSGGLAPVISGILPAEGAPGTEVVITGTDFTGATAVMFGDEEITEIEVSPEGDQVTFVVPEDAPEGVVNVTVITPEGESDDAEFNVLAAPPVPTIDLIIPVDGVVPGEEVTIQGSNFQGATEVMFGDVTIAEEDFTVSDDGTSITFNVPDDMEIGEVLVSVTTEGGTSPEVLYEVITEAADEVVFEPASGPVGTEVTLTGADFTDVESVFLGEMEIVDWAVADDGSLTFAIPDGAARGLISVNFADDQQLISAEEFIVTEEGQAINPNGSLESAEVGVIGTGEGQVMPEGWGFSGNDGTLAIFEVVDDPTQEGNRALAVEVLGLGENPWNIEARQEGIAVLPNTTYTYTVWTRGPVGTSADFTVGLPSFSELGRQTAEMTGEWQEVTFNFTTGAEDTEIRTPIHFSKAGNEGQTIYVDNLQVVPVE